MVRFSIHNLYLRHSKKYEHLQQSVNVNINKAIESGLNRGCIVLSGKIDIHSLFHI